MRLVLACLNAGKVRKTGFNRRVSAMQHMQACLSARKDRESSFHYCGSTMELVQPCLYVEKTGQSRFNPPNGCCKTCAGMLKCQERLTKQFSPLCKSGEARVALFMCRKDQIKPF